jgi:hypothetical protein
VPSAGKMMASILLDIQKIIMIDLSIKGTCYADELSLRQEIARKRRNKRTLLHDNAPAHTSQVAMVAATDCGLEILPNPQFSQELDPSDFYLFPKLKTKLHCRRFGSYEGVMEAVNEFFEDQNIQFYFEGINKLAQVGKAH